MALTNELDQTKTPMALRPLSMFETKGPDNGFRSAYRPHHGHHKSMNARAEVLLDPSINPTPKYLADLEKRIKGAPSADARLKLVKDAMKNSKEPQKIMDTALKATEGAEKAELIGGLMQGNRELTTQLLDNTKHDARHIGAANLRDVSVGAVEALPFNMLDVRGAQFPPDIDLRQNAFMNGANLDRTVMPGVKISPAADVSVRDAKMHQSAPITEDDKLNVAALAIKGAVTDQKFTDRNHVTMPMGDLAQGGVKELAAAVGPKVQLATPFSDAPSFS